MNVFIIAALTADGLIAKHARHPADWTSKEDKAFFRKKSKKGSVVIMGSRTYKTIGKPLPGRLNIIYTRSPKKFKKFNSKILRPTQDTPRKLIKNLKKQGFKEVAICGGASIYTMFLKSGLVNKLYLTIEPLLFGKGLTLFNQSVEKKLRLVKLHKLSKHVIVLEYNL